MNLSLQRIGMLAAVLTASLAATAYDFEDNGIAYNVTDQAAKTVEVTGNDNGYSGDITVPASVSYNGEQYAVTSIGDGAFYRCTELTSITLPNSLTSIENSAFEECFGLTSITLPNFLASIGDDAFQNCYGLTSVTLPNSLASLGDYAFLNCIGLTSITLPRALTSIGESVFYGCDSLISIDVVSDNQSFSSLDGILYDKQQTTLICCPFGKTGVITVPNSVTSIENSAFEGCAGITSITLPNSLTSIGDGAFDYCTGLTSINIPNSVTSIGEEVFSCCRSLTSITLPNSVTSIGGDAFSGCTGLTSITSLAVTPPECASDSFDKVDTQNCTLYVPEESIDDYKQTPVWKEFNNITAVSGIDAVEADSTTKVQIFNLNGTTVSGATENLPAGIYIVRQGAVTKKIIIK